MTSSSTKQRKRRALKTWLYQGEQRNVLELAAMLGVSTSTAYERALKGTLDVPVDEANRRRGQTCSQRRTAEREARGLQRISDLTPFPEDEECQRIVRENPDGLSLDLVGEHFGVSRERIRQIEIEVGHKLRARLRLGGTAGQDVRNMLEYLSLKRSMHRATCWDMAELHAPGDIGISRGVSTPSRKRMSA